MAKQRKGSSRSMTQNSSSEAQKQREAAQKAATRVALQSQISTLNTTLARVNLQISSLTTEKSNLITYLSNWVSQKTLYDCNSNLCEVVISNVFEGECADRVKIDLDSCVLNMTHTHSVVGGLSVNVGAQITRLNEYVTYINSRLSALRYELNTL